MISIKHFFEDFSVLAGLGLAAPGMSISVYLQIKLRLVY